MAYSTESALEESSLNFVKNLSLTDHDENPKAKFIEKAISVETIPNNGAVYERGQYYGNKCCLISIRDGLKLRDITTIDNETITPFLLMQKSGFVNRTELIDTDIPRHQEVLNRLANLFPEVQFQFFVQHRFYDHMTDPCPKAIYGNGDIVIRILNMGCHFECIKTDDSSFPRKPRMMTNEIAFKQQSEIERQIKQNHLNEQIAKQVEKELIEKEKKEQEELDYLAAVHLAHSDDRQTLISSQNKMIAINLAFAEKTEKENQEKQEESDRQCALLLQEADRVYQQNQLWREREEQMRIKQEFMRREQEEMQREQEEASLRYALYVQKEEEQRVKMEQELEDYKFALEVQNRKSDWIYAQRHTRRNVFNL
jgi:hypothetical protein